MDLRKLLGFLPPGFSFFKAGEYYRLVQDGYYTNYTAPTKKYLKKIAWEKYEKTRAFERSQATTPISTGAAIWLWCLAALALIIFFLTIWIITYFKLN